MPSVEGRTESERVLSNFGRNQTIRARHYRPQSEQEVLDILARHRSQRVRAIGSLHSWSDVAVARDVALDMGAFAEVEPKLAEGVVRVGAGCTLKNLLERLHAGTDQTLPTLGAITRQTLAGAISTGTHGSGRQSLSHFVTAVRFAGYDASGKPAIFEYRDGDELKAARCAIGSLGVILAIELRTVPKYRIRDTVRILGRIEDALALYERHPLSQFALVPYGWKIIAWERATLPATAPATGWLRARAFRIVNLVSVDFLCHVLVKAGLIVGAPAVRALMKVLPGLLIANVPRVDDAVHVLTMKHDLFRHEEMEAFVPGSKVVEAAALLRAAIEIFAGTPVPVPPAFEDRLRAAGLYEELAQARGSYLHHYPLFLRRILPEDTLVSMASSSAEPWFSISFFTYYGPRDRDAYYRFCGWTARVLHALFGARLHWGKHYPLGAAETALIYPHLERFRSICRESDPNGVFRNDFTDRVLRL